MIVSRKSQHTTVIIVLAMHKVIVFFGASHAFVLCKVVATTVYIDNILNKAQ